MVNPFIKIDVYHFSSLENIELFTCFIKIESIITVDNVKTFHHNDVTEKEEPIDATSIQYFNGTNTQYILTPFNITKVMDMIDSYYGALRR